MVFKYFYVIKKIGGDTIEFDVLSLVAVHPSVPATYGEAIAS